MPESLVITVHFHDGRFHGLREMGAQVDWPPAPGRLFQALIAGAATGRRILDEDAQALRWLESLPPPRIAAPRARRGRIFRHFVLANDTDSDKVCGNPKRLAAIRMSEKLFAPMLFDRETPLLYFWPIGGEDRSRVAAVRRLARRLFQLGRGVDMAWADAGVLSAEQLDRLLTDYPGPIFNPTDSSAVDRRATLLAVPIVGSFDALHRTYQDVDARCEIVRQGRKRQIAWRPKPPPLVRLVPYDAPPVRLLFALRRLEDPDRFHPWPFTRPVGLVERVRDMAAERLIASLGEDRRALIDRVFGRRRDLTEADKASRIRITPLPSIGHAHADPAIRRILVEIPPSCPLRREDIAWAFTGLHLGSDPATGEIRDDSLPLLVAADDHRMLRHYGIDGTKDAVPAHRWRSVTPLALPERAARRRLDPDTLAKERGQPLETRRAVKSAADRRKEEAAAAGAVRAALRHAGVRARPLWIHVQREPFTTRGERVEAFAEDTRFSKHRLWHVEIAFAEPLAGPLVLGDGRYLGLGLMAPVPKARLAVASFALTAAAAEAPRMADRAAVLAAVRRALMALDRDLHDEPLSRLFSGHEPDGRPAGVEDGDHRHVFLVAEADDEGDDAPIRRIHVVRPDRGDPTARLSGEEKRRFEAVVAMLHLLRAGPLGVLRLMALGEGAGRPPLFGRARRWRTLTPYVATRHPKKGEDRHAFLQADIAAELARRGFPAPREIAIAAPRFTAAGDLVCHARVRFKVAVEGPLLLGRLCHRGEGAFAGES